MKTLNTEQTKFHGATYDEAQDRERLTGQLKRIADVLSDGEWIDALTLCERADVSYSAFRNRLSDLRVYHGMIIESERVRDGLWRFRYVDKMTPDEHVKYLAGLKQKKYAGDPVLWGKMWEAIYAYAFRADLVNEANMIETSRQWAMNVAHDIHTKNKSV